MTRHVRIPLLIAVVLALVRGARLGGRARVQGPAASRSPSGSSDLLSRMTIEEKVGQMTQTERATVDARPGMITTREPRLDPVGRRLDADAEHA